MTTVTKDGDLAVWTGLYDTWVQEKMPGYLVVASGTYLVVQSAISGEMEFRKVTELSSLYENTMGKVG